MTVPVIEPESMRRRLFQDGYILVADVVPSSLLPELRWAYRDCLAAEKARENVRSQWTHRAQRIQPIANFDLDTGPLTKLRDDDVWRRLVDEVLGPDFTCFNPNTTGILIEPAPRPVGGKEPSAGGMGAHRDWLNNKRYPDLAHLAKNWTSEKVLWQVNVPTLANDDPCFWIIPGSHWYLDLLAEVEQSQGPRYLPIEGTDDEARAYIANYWEGQRSRAGAQQIIAPPGCMIIYRATIRHGAVYDPLVPRNTLHEFLMTDKFTEFIGDQKSAWARGAAEEKQGKGKPWWDLPPAELAKYNVPAIPLQSG